MRVSKMLMLVAVVMSVSSAAAFGVVGPSGSGPVFQSSDSDSLTIGGNVPARVDIRITGTDALELDLQSVVTDRKIATVRERSNVRAGYVVSVTSANGFRLRGTYAGDQDELAYTLVYGDEPVVPQGNSFQFAARTGRTGLALGHQGVEFDLLISYDAESVNLYDGDYQDTLTFEIMAQ